MKGIEALEREVHTALEEAQEATAALVEQSKTATELGRRNEELTILGRELTEGRQAVEKAAESITEAIVELRKAREAMEAAQPTRIAKEVIAIIRDEARQTAERDGQVSKKLDNVEEMAARTTVETNRTSEILTRMEGALREIREKQTQIAKGVIAAIRDEARQTAERVDRVSEKLNNMEEVTARTTAETNRTSEILTRMEGTLGEVREKQNEKRGWFGWMS